VRLWTVQKRIIQNRNPHGACLAFAGLLKSEAWLSELREQYSSP
jgi:hypothetical protein